MKCWDCKGKGSNLVHSLWSGYNKEGRRIHGGGEREMTCDRCNGSGEVSVEMKEWVKRGERLREKRLAMDISMRELAEKLGCLASKVSDAETGKIDPKEIEEKLEDWMYFQLTNP